MRRFALLLALVSACGGKLAPENPQPTDDDTVNASSNEAPPGPYDVSCTFYTRDVSAGQTQFSEKELQFDSDQEESFRDVDLDGDIPVRAAMGPLSGSNDASLLHIEFPRSGLTREFVLPRDKRPTYEFVGDHGFTGLNYVSTPETSVATQFICKVGQRRKSDLHTGPANGEDQVPFKVRCDVVADGASESFIVDRATNRDVVVGKHAVHLFASDSRFDGRSVTLQVAPIFQLLLQLDPTRPIDQPLLDPGGLAGTATIDDATGHVAVSCTTRN